MMVKVSRFPWYVLFISIYPALFYWSYNVTEMSYLAGRKLVLLSFFFGLICWGLALLIIRNLRTASLVTFLALTLFWTYGHVYNYLHPINPPVFGNKFIGAIWLILFGLGTWLIFRKLSKQEPIPVILNVITAYLLILPAIKVIPAAIQESRIAKERNNQAIQAPITGISEPNYSYLPDIYYIILDSYTREDILKERFSFDNSEFISQLEQLGFYVANCSQSNYSHTQLSLSSSLNYRYLDEIVQIDPSAKVFRPLIKNSSVQRILENWGYKVVAFETGHAKTELIDADIYYSRTKGGILTITEFDISFLETSLLKPFFRAPFYRADLLKASTHRARSLYVLNRLKDATKIQSPKFVFAHVLLPHPPFVLGPDGEPTLIEYVMENGKADLKLYAKGFIDQTIYTNNRVLEIVKTILAESVQEPIIILQGDHGPATGKVPVTSILNAYYLPGGHEGLYETISPVNTFRYIFNTYFGQNLEIHEDISRWSSTKKLQAFEVIPNKCTVNQSSNTK